MQLSAVLHTGVLISLLTVFASASNEDLTMHQKQRQSIYAYMSERFEGNPSEIEVKLVSNSVLEHFGFQITKQNLYKLSRHAFKLSRRTGIPELWIMNCMVNQNDDLPWKTAAANCVGAENQGLSTML